MNHRIRALLALVLVPGAFILAVPDALAQKKDNAIKCPGTLRDDLQPTSGPVKDLDVVGKCNVKAAAKYTFDEVNIKDGGALLFDDATIEFEASSITIQGGGTIQTGLEPGRPAAATKQLVIRLLGERPSSVDRFKSLSDDACNNMVKGIGVKSGGTLALYGKRGVLPDSNRNSNIGGTNLGSVSWTYLAKPAGPTTYQDADGKKKIGAPVGALDGPLVLHLAANVTAHWRPGDWIVVGTTSFSPFESEFVQIDKVDPEGAGTRITLKAETPLRHYHFGSADPGWPSSANASDGATTNFGVDERAGVGLISRTVKLTAAVPNWKTATQAQEASLAWGGELKVCPGFKKVALEGVEIERFGKENLGSYPVHLHMLMDVQPGTLTLNSNSIHHSYNHCVTLHMTNNVTVSNSVCARAIGHLFYEEVPKGFDPHTGSVIMNSGLKYHDNLGLGAMAHDFGVGPRPESGIVTGFWEGDYLSRTGDGYYGLYVQNTDDKSLAVTGQCFQKQGNGLLDAAVNPLAETPPRCAPANPYYYEPPTGFWIINPGTELVGNSIGGCQSTGKAYWYLPPTTQNWQDTRNNNLQLAYIAPRFTNNRAHACYDGIFGEGEAGVTGVQQLQPKVDADNNKQNTVSEFKGFTASRIRNRGVWMRPTWFAFQHARVAMSREGVTLVTSGGLDGNSPGVWGILKDSTIIGVSTNNVDRWGPCPGTNNAVELPGCVDKNSDASTYVPKSYPSPAWNFAGFYIYDGPARIHDVRFVNFHKEPEVKLLTAEDATFQAGFTAYFNGFTKYEGDAALGWFQNNQSAYPTATDVRGLRWDSVDLRHQVFTEKVNFGNFDDGDKNTAVIDRDGSLTGFKVSKAGGGEAPEDYPISLNNLPFNAASNAVDECLAMGTQDKIYEGRPTSLISPANYGTLEFEAFMTPDLAPGVVPRPPANENEKQSPVTQWMTFTKDMVDYQAHQQMRLHSRNNQGIWEPKVTNKHGYTVTVANANGVPGATPKPGMPPVISVGLNDIVKPRISNEEATYNAFYVRVGVCYTGKRGVPNGKFSIKRGYRSWGGGPINFAETKIRTLFTPIDGQNSYNNEVCFNLSAQNPNNLNNKEKGCPAHGVIGRAANAECPAGFEKAEAGVTRQPICIIKPSDAFTPVASLDKLTDPKTGLPVDIKANNYFWDSSTGMLFFYVKQDRPNVVYTSPLGSCDVSSPPWYCPNPKGDPPESYYACPPEGCATYTVRLDDPDYEPVESACSGDVANAAKIYDLKLAYVQPKLEGENKLAYKEDGKDNGTVVKELDQKTEQGFYHRTATIDGTNPRPPVCTGAPAAASFNNLVPR